MLRRADHCRAASLVADGSAGVTVLAATLIELALSGEIRVLVGPWQDREPRSVETAEVEELLADPRRYSSAEEVALGLERVYVANVVP
jgi:hypothetical protein